MKRMICLILTLCLLAGCSMAGAESQEFTEGERKALEMLSESLEKDAVRQIAAVGEVTDLYSELPASFTADTDSFPEKFDLRDRGIVPAVKNQSPWGTCWTFGTSAACETSLLSMLGLTTEGYKEKFGVDMDISERHLAWFTAMPLPEVSDYPEGEYPYDASQAGEGCRIREGLPPLMAGGSYMMSASSLASGIGVVAESIAPYEANEELPEGETDLRKGDWSLPDQYRFVQSFQLKDTNVLPSPAGTDADGNYVYRPEGTAAIKRELVQGRAVAAGYETGADQLPDPPKETKRANYEAELSLTELSDEEKEILIQVLIGDLDPLTLPDEQLWKFLQARCEAQMVEKGTYSFSDLSHEDLALLTTENALGWTPDECRQSKADAEEKRVRFFSDTDPVIWAQYSKNVVLPNHATCIVGWDDTFPASFFPENHRPPADGAWICRNSYSTAWGMEGYFYLSYYDRSFGMPQTFEFANDADMQKIETFGILQYDYMPAEMINSTVYDTPVYAANVFTVKEAQTVLRYVSAMTGEPDTQVTASVWLLKEGAASPTDGKLLASVTDTFTYAGYHRMELAESLLLPAGARVGITVLQRVADGEKVKYALVNTSSQGEKSPRIETRWYVSKVNTGESYVSFEEGRWLDWRTVLDNVSGEGNRACIAYDNLPVKGYVYARDEILAIHDLDTRISTAGGEAAICPDCGYVLEFLEP
ncbi:MAG: hypothetical protein IJQ71_10135 [Clostridia bacterium]|nr:hypothetical protein [Clostridia bacterium]